MTNWNIIQHGIQKIGLGVMISRCSLNSQHWEPDWHPANVDCSRYASNEQINHSHQIPHHRKWTREDNKLALYCYFQTNPAKWGYRKRMIEIWPEFSKFRATNQRLADQVRSITKNGWFSDLETLEIHQQIYRHTHQQTPNTVTETINTGKPEIPNQTLWQWPIYRKHTNRNTDPRGKI